MEYQTASYQISLGSALSKITKDKNMPKAINLPFRSITSMRLLNANERGAYWESRSHNLSEYPRYADAFMGYACNAYYMQAILNADHPTLINRMVSELLPS